MVKKLLKETVKKYYGIEFGENKIKLNCAEAIIYAANDEYDLHLEKEALKTMSPFGGGMQIQSICGALTGSLAVIGILFTNKAQHEGEKIKEITTEFFNEINTKLGSNLCGPLKEKYKNDTTGCLGIVMEAADTLDKLVCREKNLN